MDKIQNYIDGALVAPLKGNYIDNYNPSTGKVYSLIPDSDEEDVKKAVIAAGKAFPSWSTMRKEERSQWILQLADLLEERLEQFALAESIDNGKPLWLSRSVDIPRAVSNLRFFATGILHFPSEAHNMEGRAINYTLRDPVGIAGCISPWNLPLYLFTWKVAPALASGCCVVSKPSEITPMTAYMLSQLCVEIGFPKGVFNILHGYGQKVGSAIVSHPDIKAISFTGGTATGKNIASVAAPMFKKLSLELGGKNPVVIFSDCNWEKMMKTTLDSSFSNQGEICLCGSRILIEKNVYDKFRDEFVQKTKALKVGPPLLNEEAQNFVPQLGAIVSKQHHDKILSYIELAKKEGGKILCGGKAVKMTGEYSDGWYIEPTVIEGLPQDCRTNKEEIFGPVVTLMPFETEEEAIEFANGTEYGLTSMLWTENLTRTHKMAAEFRSGIVWINCWLLRDLRTPFGGMKNSGVGREGGWEAIRFFTEAKNVCVKL
jgi:aminomuconate-semialdehyde/2-hydroxymuconate-6-semialdehyde dehydrogenase